MKEAIIVDLNGLFIEPTLVTDDVTGVFPIYEPKLEGNAEEVPQLSPEIIGYTVAIAVPTGLSKPKFDFKAWELYKKQLEGKVGGINKPLQEVKLWIEGQAEEFDMQRSTGEEKNITFAEKMKNWKHRLVSIYRRLLNSPLKKKNSASGKYWGNHNQNPQMDHLPD